MAGHEKTRHGFRARSGPKVGGRQFTWKRHEDHTTVPFNRPARYRRTRKASPMTKNHRTPRKAGKSHKAHGVPAHVAAPEPVHAEPEQTVEVTAKPAELTFMQRIFS
jgi:hypothetical protein